MTLLAIGWEPELRGILTVVIAVVILMGSVYGIMATNMGARLAFLVALTALAGWMMLMGLTWWIYGIGLRGEDPTWAAVPGKTVLQSPEALVQAEVLDTMPDIPDDATYPEQADLVSQALIDQGFVILDPASPAFGQAQAQASVFIEEEGAFESGEYVVTEVFDIGGEDYPKINDTFDFLAFWHTPHYVLVEVSPLVPTYTEPGRAPAPAQIDDSRPVQYVYMVRDLGTRRQPAVVLTIGGLAIFLALCYLLHRRDRVVRDNEAQPIPAARPQVEASVATSDTSDSGDKTPVGV